MLENCLVVWRKPLQGGIIWNQNLNNPELFQYQSPCWAFVIYPQKLGTDVSDGSCSLLKSSMLHSPVLWTRQLFFHSFFITAVNSYLLNSVALGLPLNIALSLINGDLFQCLQLYCSLFFKYPSYISGPDQLLGVTLLILAPLYFAGRWFHLSVPLLHLYKSTCSWNCEDAEN